MDFDRRWTDDPRDRDDRGRELSQGSRGGLSNPRERELLDARDVFTRDLELPRGRERDAATAAYYRELRARGHRHGRALRSVVDRWLRILVAMLRENMLYNARRFTMAATVENGA